MMTSRKYCLPFALAIAGLFIVSLVALVVSADDMQMSGPEDKYHSNLNIRWDILQDVVGDGEQIYNEIVITSHGYPVEGAKVILTSSHPDNATVSTVNDTTDIDGKVGFYVIGHAGNQSVETTINAIATYNGNEPVIDSYRIDVHPKKMPGMEIPGEVWYIGAGALAIVALGAGVTESGKYAILKFAAVPLYSRVKKEEVLDHFVRGQIYGYIMSHPGQHYNAIKQELRVTNGTLSHHLKTLEMQGFIKSHRDGTYKRFYPVGATLAKNKGIRLSDLQLGILDNLRQSPGMTQSEVAKAMGMSQQSVSYNLNILCRNDIIRFERSGVRKHYYINEEAPDT